MDNLYSLKKAYSQTKYHTESELAKLNSELANWFSLYPQYQYLHPCVIEDRPALICKASLSITDSKAYLSLETIAEKFGILVKEDRREKSQSKPINRRTNKLALFGFCLGLMSSPVSSRIHKQNDFEKNNSSISSYKAPINRMTAKTQLVNGQKVIRLMHLAPPSKFAVKRNFLKQYKQKLKASIDNDTNYSKILKFLEKTYLPQKNDPVTLTADFKKLAHYFQQFHEVIKLFDLLKQQNIQLVFKKSHWQAQAIGTQNSVDRVIVYFDTRIGAQVWNHSQCHNNPACFISPADALLHELLHTKLMLLETDEFINSGGMKPALYLYNHEIDVIKEENQLFQQMTRHDGLIRPLRSRHEGHLHETQCVLCLPGINTDMNYL